MAQKSPPRKKRINLALQGGGAHGAFTWGVLDRLLEDERIALEGISGTSAGVAALDEALRQDRGVHRAGAGAADAFERDALVLEQPVEHAPREGAVRTATL